jgi:hypothetical protein
MDTGKNNSQTDFKRKRIGMLDFVKRAFRNGIAAILWINLILSTIAGGIIGYSLGRLISYKNAGGYTFWGIVIGFICGLLTDIVGGGFITTILNIDEKIEAINNHLLGTGSTSNGKSTDINLSSVPHKKNPIQHSGKAYNVITATKIFYERDINSNVIKDLDVGDQVYFQYEVKEGQIMWFFVKAFNAEGWCKAEYLKEC